jgi:hypothetical protein
LIEAKRLSSEVPHEGVVALQEITHKLQVKRLGGLLLKLNFEKAYYRVNFDFLHEVLHRQRILRYDGTSSNAVGYGWSTCS